MQQQKLPEPYTQQEHGPGQKKEFIMDASEKKLEKKINSIQNEVDFIHTY